MKLYVNENCLEDCDDVLEATLEKERAEAKAWPFLGLFHLSSTQVKSGLAGFKTFGFEPNYKYRELIAESLIFC